MASDRHRLGLALIASSLVLGALILVIVFAAPATSLWVNLAVPVAKNDRAPPPCRGSGALPG